MHDKKRKKERKKIHARFEQYKALKGIGNISRRRKRDYSHVDVTACTAYVVEFLRDRKLVSRARNHSIGGENGGGIKKGRSISYHSCFSGTLLRLEEDRFVLTAARAELVCAWKLRERKDSQYRRCSRVQFEFKFVSRWSSVHDPIALSVSPQTRIQQVHRIIGKDQTRQQGDKPWGRNRRP
jgi:hypothetical protein